VKLKLPENVVKLLICWYWNLLWIFARSIFNLV